VTGDTVRETRDGVDLEDGLRFGAEGDGGPSKGLAYEDGRKGGFGRTRKGW
jgi:hypothetical protein